MFVGMGAAKVRDLFKQANEKAPCIVFIDEIDTIGKKRDGGGMSGNDEREQTLNQLLTEMDGFDGKKGVVILAATNRPESLDPALLRPGRFDRRVPVELPDLKGREAILKVHGQKVKMSDDVDYNAIARATAGASGAELANIVNEAALRAVRFGRKAVCQEDLQESVETVIAGYQKKNAVIPPDERRIVAYHEVGHALVAACQTHSAPVQKITIIPRTSGALGYTMQVDQGERYLMSRDEALNKIATFTGGRAAEEVIFHSITTGASNDIEQATKIARAMVTRYGMTDELWFLQTRNGKRTGAAMVKIAMDLLRQGMIDEKTALERCEPNKLDELLHPVFDKKALKEAKVLTRGLPASPGAATGQIVFFADDAAKWAADGKKVVMVRIETSPEDLAGMAVAEGILTARGGMTSHAAVVARGMGKCCVSGAGAINVDYKTRTVEIEGITLKEGDFISLNGTTGEVYKGKVETKAAEVSGDFAALMDLCNKYTKLNVRTNADTPHDAEVARAFWCFRYRSLPYGTHVL